jgi:predicted acyltransferase
VSGAARERLVSLDAFRGSTVAGMLLVNDPGSWSAIYPPLRHAAWHGWTPTDLIFPFFLFITGISCHLSLDGRKGALPKLLRRVAILFLLGLVLNGFPFYPVAERLLSLRIPGVLQRIALCTLAGGLLTLNGGRRSQIAVLVGLLLGYWALLMAMPAPGSGATGLAAVAEPSGTLAAWLDRTLFDWGGWGNHLWGQSRSWDPEGALSTVPAIGSLILGLLAGRWIRTEQRLPRRLLGLAGAGATAAALGLVWDLWFPINKNLWTSSYVLFTGGLAALLLAGFMALIDLRRSIWWTPPLLAFGINPILAYFGSEIMAIVIYEIVTLPHDGRQVALQEWFYDTALASWLPDRLASLAFALLFVALWYAILRQFQRRGVILKV